jgi:tetratricopeptide (TPR) repeat protein
MLRPVLPLITFLLTIAPSFAADSHWIHLQTTNFEMYSSAGPHTALDTIREFEQVRGFFLQSFGGPATEPVPVRLVAFATPKEYEPYRPNEFAVAFYHESSNRDYIVMSHGGAEIFPVAVHEYVHLLVRHSGLKLPPWLNEGMAELYSTLKPYGGKILIGDLIPGRRQALLNEKWVPLETILTADHDSPYYNEKDKAGSLYNEGWALTHMLCLRDEYRPKFGQLLRAVSGGKDSAAALLEIYGKTVPQIDKDLHAYLNGMSFQGLLVSAKLDKVSGDIPVEPLSDFDTSLMLSDLLDSRGKESQRLAALQKLIEQDPKRPEPYVALGYAAWASGKHEDAVHQFAMAYERGDRDPKLLWDYGRLLETSSSDEAISVLSELLSHSADRADVRLELAEVQYRDQKAAAALATLAPLRKVTPEESARFFRIVVYSYLASGDAKSAEAAARHFLDAAKTDNDRAAAQRLVDAATSRTARAVTAPSELAAEGRPTDLESHTPQSMRASTTGHFTELLCQGSQARMVIQTDAGKKVFLIEDPGTVAITGQADWQVEMTCGPQKKQATVEVSYDPPRANQTGVDGIVKRLAFQ